MNVRSFAAAAAGLLGLFSPSLQAQQPPPSGGGQSMNPDMAFILDVAAAAFSGEPVQTGGHDPLKNGFNFQQLELSVGAGVDPYLRFDANLVFSPFGVEIEEAYGTSLSLPAGFQVRAGQFLNRFGRINPTHPHSWSFVDQPLVIGRYFGSEGNRGLGVEGSWLTPLPWYSELIVSVGDTAGECCSRSYSGSDEIPIQGPADLLYTGALKQFWNLGEGVGMFWGLSAQAGPNTSGNGNHTNVFGTDLLFKFKLREGGMPTSLVWQSELLARSRQVPGDVLQDLGAYSQLVLHRGRRWEGGARYEWLAPVEDDPLDPGLVEPTERVSAQLTFYPSHFSRLRAQGSRAVPGDGGAPTWAALLALELLSGAHGAHAY